MDRRSSMVFKTHCYVNCYWKPTPEFYDWVEQNKEWVVPINANPECRYSGMENLADIDKDMQELNFTLNEISTLLAIYHRKPPAEVQYVSLSNYRRVFDGKEIDELLQDHPDAIFGYPIQLGYYGNPVTVARQYPLMHVDSDFAAFLAHLSCQSWVDLDCLQKWLHLNCLVAPCNSFVMVREVYNQFCERLEKVIVKTVDDIGLKNIAKRDAYQRRAGAFLSERFTSFYCFQMLSQGQRVKFASLEFKENFAEKKAEVDANGTIRSN